MGECFIMRRGGSIYRLPVLDGSYPKDVSVAVIDGQKECATFEAVIAAAGNPAAYTFQWYVDGVPVDGAINSSFTVDNITDAAVRNVYCELTNKAGTVATRTATLIVSRNDSPVLDTGYPADVTCDVGESATFETKIIKDGTSTDYTYQWYVDDVAVEGENGATYKITNASLGKHRVFCKVTTTAGTVTSRVATLKAETLTLYSMGNQHREVTGGWVYRNLEVEGEVLSPEVCLSTANSIDLTNYSKLCFEGTMFDYTNGEHPEAVGVCLWSLASYNTLKNPSIYKFGSSGNFSLDVSWLRGKYYICYFVGERDYGAINVRKLYLKV